MSGAATVNYRFSLPLEPYAGLPALSILPFAVSFPWMYPQ